MTKSIEALSLESNEVKACCANLYEHEAVQLLLGDSFHPGGLALTEKLGQLLDLQPGQQLLDVAAGKGTSAIFLAQRFGCEVVGLDYSSDSIEAATIAAEEAGVAHLVRFEQGDAEQLPFPKDRFDAVICECAFCTFPDKPTAAQEFARVLRTGGRLGLSDLTRSGALPAELSGLLGWIACLADAQPIDDYVAYLSQAGLPVSHVEPQDAALTEMVKGIKTRLIGAELMVKLKKIELPLGIEFDQAKHLIRVATEAIQQKKLGYAVMIGNKP